MPEAIPHASHFFGDEAARALEYTAHVLPRVSELAEAPCNLTVLTAGQLTLQLARLPGPLPSEVPTNFTPLAGGREWQVGYQFRSALPHETADTLDVDPDELRALAWLVEPITKLPLGEISLEAGEIPIVAGALDLTKTPATTRSQLLIDDIFSVIRRNGVRSDLESLVPPYWLMIAMGRSSVDFRPFTKLPPVPPPEQ